MQRIILFLIRNKNFLLFLLLFSFSLALTVQSNTYQRNRFANSTNSLSGGLYSIRSSILSYFQLAEENNILQEENRRLRTMLSERGVELDSSKPASLPVGATFRYVPAQVINNSYGRSRNQLTINAGERDSISIDRGVISSAGVVGIVTAVSEKYSSVQSILNTGSQVNAKLAKSGHFGTLTWDTTDPNRVQLIEIPRLAPVSLGDTIVTGGRSTIFPEGILIGTVAQFDRPEDGDFYSIDVQLFTDMTSLSRVYVIETVDASEIESLENTGEDEE